MLPRLVVKCILCFKLESKLYRCCVSLTHTRQPSQRPANINLIFNLHSKRCLRVCDPSRWFGIFLFCSSTNSRYIVSSSVRTHVSAAAANTSNTLFLSSGVEDESWSSIWVKPGFFFSLTGLISCSFPHLHTTATFSPAWAGKVLILLRVDYVWIRSVRYLTSVSLRQTLRTWWEPVVN